MFQRERGDQSPSILVGAYLIRIYLPELLGPDVAPLDHTLTGLLNLSKIGWQVDSPIEEVLACYGQTRQWIEQYLRGLRIEQFYERSPTQEARFIRAYLPELLGPAATPLDDTLCGLLALAKIGKQVDSIIREVLDYNEQTRRWIDQYFSSSFPTLPYGCEPTPGPPSKIDLPTEITVCTYPYGDFTWVSRAKGDKPPSQCSKHGALNCT